MKKLFLTALCAAVAVSVSAQDKKDEKPKEEKKYEFTVVKEIPMTSVKDQAGSGTCWSFSGIGLLESELLRQGKGEYDLSEMWIVRNAYRDKAEKYIRMHGTVEFSGGGATDNVFEMIRRYGIVPESEYAGLNYGTDRHRHGELDAVMRAYADAVIKNKNRSLSTAWLDGMDGILDAYLGRKPESFVYEGVEYTPQTFAEHLGLNMDDYISITSYTHHPFYTQFAVEVPDNWSWATSYNVPLEEMMSVIDNALENGYAVEWGSDVSEKGFKWNDGYAIVPEVSGVKNLQDSEKAKWSKLTDEEKAASEGMQEGERKEITQEMRQQAFDNYETTDDHGMIIVGIARDGQGDKFYKVKNSWGTENHIYDGYFYASEPFVAYKTMSITVHKDAIPKELRKKLGIK